MPGDIPAHEKLVAEIAREIGFPQVSTSHEASPLIKFVGRGDTTVVDAYLTPILQRYVDLVSQELDVARTGARLMFMTSAGGLTSPSASRARMQFCPGRRAAWLVLRRPAARRASTR